MSGWCLLLDDIERTPGAWWRRRHPGEPMPLWLAAHISGSPQEYDPDGLHEWRPLSRVQVPLSDDIRAPLGHLIQLRPLRGKVTLSAVDEQGWHPFETGLRRHDAWWCGIPTSGHVFTDLGALQYMRKLYKRVMDACLEQRETAKKKTAKKAGARRRP